MNEQTTSKLQGRRRRYSRRTTAKNNNENTNAEENLNGERCTSLWSISTAACDGRRRTSVGAIWSWHSMESPQSNRDADKGACTHGEREGIARIYYGRAPVGWKSRMRGTTKRPIPQMRNADKFVIAVSICHHPFDRVRFVTCRFSNSIHIYALPTSPTATRPHGPCLGFSSSGRMDAAIGSGTSLKMSATTWERGMSASGNRRSMLCLVFCW